MVETEKRTHQSEEEMEVRTRSCCEDDDVHDLYTGEGVVHVSVRILGRALGL